MFSMCFFACSFVCFRCGFDRVFDVFLMFVMCVFDTFLTCCLCYFDVFLMCISFVLDVFGVLVYF